MQTDDARRATPEQCEIVYCSKVAAFLVGELEDGRLKVCPDCHRDLMRASGGNIKSTRIDRDDR